MLKKLGAGKGLFRNRNTNESKSGDGSNNNNNNPRSSAGSAASASQQQQQSSSSASNVNGSGTGSAGGSGRPGSFRVDGSSAVFRVTVPEDVLPGQEFQVYAGNRIVRVRCPPGSSPGQSLQITVPIEPQHPSSGAGASQELQNNLPPDSPNVAIIEHSDPTAYMVTIEDGVRGGQQFPVTIQGQQLMVTCPVNARPGMQVRIVPPPPPADLTAPPTGPRGSGGGGHGPGGSLTSSGGGSAGGSGRGHSLTNGGGPGGGLSGSGTSAAMNSSMRSSTNSQQSGGGGGGGSGGGIQRKKKQKEKEQSQLFEVEVPEGVQPGQPFALLAGGVRVLVTCPLNAGPGQRIRFKLPLALTQKREPENEAAAIKLSYDKDGWTRTIRVSDMKFQWVRMDQKGDVETNVRFDAEKSAYVRKLEFRQGTDPRIRDGLLSLVPAEQAFVDSRIKGVNDEDLVTYSDIAEAQGKSFEDKAQWFQQKCSMLCVEWNEGHMRMNVRRQFLLEDSVDAVMSLSRKDLRKLWRFEFIGEMGIDAGGLAREWFQLVTSEIFDPDMGLWQSSETNQMCMQINPASKYVCDDYLVYYRFLGRVMGKALFDGQLVVGHMVQYMYKHMLGWPITLKDIESLDEEYYNNLLQLKQLTDNGEDLSMLCLDFSTMQEVMGAKEEIELVEGGKDIDLTNDNFPEYLEACLKYRMADRVKPQLNELLLGFFDVIPEPLLTVFDFQELELLMCGLPVIDLDDWKQHTEYSGEYENLGGEYPSCQWFWEVVEDFDQEMKARLLQFVTGTSGVPSRGFGVLQGNDGNIRKFTIHAVSVNICLYPRAHTCFNRIDLPTYETKEELRDRLKLAVTMVATGFDIE